MSYFTRCAATARRPGPPSTGRAGAWRGRELRGDHLDQYLAHGVHIWPHLTPPDPTAEVGEVRANIRLDYYLLNTADRAQNPVPARACGFNSRPRYHSLTTFRADL